MHCDYHANRNMNYSMQVQLKSVQLFRKPNKDNNIIQKILSTYKMQHKLSFRQNLFESAMWLRNFSKKAQSRSFDSFIYRQSMVPAQEPARNKSKATIKASKSKSVVGNYNRSSIAKYSCQQNGQTKESHECILFPPKLKKNQSYLSARNHKFISLLHPNPEKFNLNKKPSLCIDCKKKGRITKHKTKDMHAKFTNHSLSCALLLSAQPREEEGTQMVKQSNDNIDICLPNIQQETKRRRLILIKLNKEN